MGRTHTCSPSCLGVPLNAGTTAAGMWLLEGRRPDSAPSPALTLVSGAGGGVPHCPSPPLQGSVSLSSLGWGGEGVTALSTWSMGPGDTCDPQNTPGTGVWTEPGISPSPWGLERSQGHGRARGCEAGRLWGSWPKHGVGVDMTFIIIIC